MKATWTGGSYGPVLGWLGPWSLVLGHWALRHSALNYGSHHIRSERNTAEGRRCARDATALGAARRLGLTGTKFGCGMALCGACTVHVDGQPVRSCTTVMKSVAGKRVTTIEGLSANGTASVQRAWIESDVPQCGYCQSGQIMSAAALLARKPKPDRRRYRRSDARQPVPLRHVPIDSCRRFTAPRSTRHRRAGMSRSTIGSNAGASSRRAGCDRRSADRHLSP